MSWLGKIMTFLVLIGSLVWAFFTVSAYATRTNWKVRADGYEKALKESESNRVADQRAQETKVAEMSRLLEAEKDRAKKLNDDYEKLATDSKAADDKFKKQEALTAAATQRLTLMAASEKAVLDELKSTRERNALLENNIVTLTLSTQVAIRERLRAENDAKLQRAIADDNARKIENLTAQVTELRQTGGGGGTAVVARSIEKAPAPLPDNVRGTVTRDMSGDFVQLSIGIDAGLEAGSKLDVYRESEGKYLGTLVIQGGSLRPKEAVAVFRPARGVPVSQLRPDELPRKGDTVGIVR